MNNLNTLLEEIRACTNCAAHLPLGPRPVVRAHSDAKIIIIGQAPGTRVHESGIPWDDKSGERLRDWLQLSPDEFYDERRIAIMPMGFCYPGVIELAGDGSNATNGGKTKKGGDKPPRPECPPLWHDKLLNHLPHLQITLLVGQYAQAHYLRDRRSKTLTQTVSRWQEFSENAIWPLPHPSWRTIGWQKKNPWFETGLLKALRQQIRQIS